MTVIGLLTEFLNIATLAGIIILTRFIKTTWIVIAIAVTLIILGLFLGGGVSA